MGVTKKPASRVPVVKKMHLKKKPATLKKPASVKKPASFFMPIPPKKGAGLKVFRRPTSRPHAYSKRDVPGRGVKRNRIPPATAGIGATSWSDFRVAKHLVKIKLLPPIKACPKCGSNVVGTRVKDKFRLWGYRCVDRDCRLRISRVTHHPIFKSTSGTPLPLASQWDILRGIMLHQTQASLHLSLGIQHSSIERFASRVRYHVQAYVTQRQKTIKYGEPGKVVEIEADEVTICRFDSGCADAPISWIGYVGIVARGRPRSLRLHRLPVRNTDIRSPGPGPITVQQWLPLTRACFTKGQECVLHTDSARAYSRDIPHVHHTSVVHQLKKVGGVWIRPVFSAHKKITLEN
eukprot:6490599-Amphidinium_carterae.1